MGGYTLQKLNCRRSFFCSKKSVGERDRWIYQRAVKLSLRDPEMLYETKAVSLFARKGALKTTVEPRYFEVPREMKKSSK